MRKQTLLTSILTCAVIALGSLVQVQAADEKKADATGTWTWTQQQQGRGGANANTNATPAKSTLKLKAEGEKLTGTLSQPARGGGRGQPGAAAAPAPVETEISDGKVKGDEISFSVKRTFGQNEIVIKYTGKVDGDTIKGKTDMPGRNGGDPTSRDWEAKREAAAKK